MFQNGVAQQSSTGAWAGGLNMAGYTPGDVADLATLNLTGFGSAAVQLGTILRIVDRSTELPDTLQWALDFNLANSQQFTISVDAFANLNAYGEYIILSRIYGGGGNYPAPCMNVSGSTWSQYDGEYIRARFSGGNIGSQALAKDNNNASFYGSQYNSAIAWGSWAWHRYRIEDAGGGNKRRRFKVWTGSIDDESTGWNFDNTASSPIGAPLGGLGWGGEAVGVSTSFSSVAYFAFSENPAVQVPPPPNQIAGGSAGADYLAQLSW